MVIKISGNLGDWVKTPELINTVLGEESQEVSISITYQNKEGIQAEYTLRHKDFIKDIEEEAGK